MYGIISVHRLRHDLEVVYTERGDNIHIISARVAEPFERNILWQ